MSITPKRSNGIVLTALGLPALMVVSNLSATGLVPAEVEMGETQRILYVHVAVAWISLIGFMVMAGTGIQYLRGRDLAWDHWSQSAAELGWLSCTLTLISGSLWAHEAWGTWWTWDPRLSTAFILWLLYSACLIVRSNLRDEHVRARYCAVLATVGLIDVPFVTMATRWFRGIHPVTPEMDPIMRQVLAMTVISYTIFFMFLLVQRQRQVHLAHALSELAKDQETLRRPQDAAAPAVVTASAFPLEV